MFLDVKPILRTPGKQLEFNFVLDLSDVDFAGRYPVSQPVEVKGRVRNSADILTLTMEMRSTLDAVCDRCGKEFRRGGAICLDVLWERGAKSATRKRLAGDLLGECLPKSGPDARFRKKSS